MKKFNGDRGLPTRVHRCGTPVLFLLTLLLVVMHVCACKPRQNVICSFPDDLLYSASLDSIGIAEFLQLTPERQLTRQRQALVWLSRARQQTRTDKHIRALHNSLGLAPDQPDVWLELAELTRWTGDYQDAQTYLENARLSVQSVQPERRRSLRNQIAQAYSWHYYERGEWRKGMAWSDSSMVYSPEDRNTLLIRGLMLACFGQIRYAEDVARNLSRRDVFNTDVRWIRGMNDWGQGWYEEASFSFPNTSGTERRRSECMQDKGMVEEHVGHWDEARLRYEHAAADLPFSDLSCVTKHTHQVLASSRENSKMPVWLAFDRYFIVGSRSAYTNIANQNFENATSAAEREFWAQATIDAASICIRKKSDVSWALEVRGVVFAKLERFGLARQDLRRAIREFENTSYEPARALAWLGHVHLMEESYEAALPLLHRAVAADPQAPVAWSDLGLALIKAGEMETAVQALDTAISLDPELAVAWYNRGLTHFHAKRWPEAVIALEEAMRLAPGNENIQQILQRAIMMEKRTASSEEPVNE